MAQSSKGSVSRWIADLKAGDKDATRLLWERFYPKLVNQARKLLDSRTRRVTDEEDIAAIAFNSFFKAAQAGRFPKLHDRHDLWEILLMLTERKAADQKKHAHRQKRGGGKVRGDSAFDSPNAESDEHGIEQVVARGPSPEFAEMFADLLRHLLELLPDDTHRDIAIWKMRGDTVKEIADKQGCVPGTIERKLRLIRSLWRKELRDE